jgi:hypothetical protein
LPGRIKNNPFPEGDAMTLIIQIAAGIILAPLLVFVLVATVGGFLVRADEKRRERESKWLEDEVARIEREDAARQGACSRVAK